MTGKEAALKLTLHHMQCGMLMPIEWVKQNGEGSELSEVFRMATSALREQSLGNEKQATETSDKKTSEGCEYCTDSKSIYEIKSPLHDSYNTDVYISEDAMIVDIGCHSYGASKIKFCPMCGRRLEEV